MIEVFKTDVTSDRQAEMLVLKLQEIYRNCKINFDLPDCDHILRIQSLHGIFSITPAIELLRDYGFFAEVLPDEVPNSLLQPSKLIRL